MRALRWEGLIFLLVVAGFVPAEKALGAERGLEFLPPAGCLPADNGPAFDIHVYVWGRTQSAGKLILETEWGSFGQPKEIDPGLYRARFTPKLALHRKTVTFKGSWKTKGLTIQGSIVLPLCSQPVGRVVVRAEPERLLAGEGQQAYLHIQVFDSAGKAQAGLPLEITTNVGKIKFQKDLGDGKYQAVFLPPGDPFPQVANVVVASPVGARLDRVAVARAVIPITARLELPGKTAPGTRMQMSIAGRTFGPVQADQRGKFKMPILVPPGYGKSKATSIDRVGNKKSRWVNLFLPETNQLGIWAYPLELPADGHSRSRLLVTTIDPYGAPTDMGSVKIAARAGKIGKVKRIAKGLYEAYYGAPTSVSGGKDRVEVVFPGGGRKSHASVEIRLLPGPADSLSLEAPQVLAADGRSQGEITVKVNDSAGNPVEGLLLKFSVSPGRVTNIREVKPGVHRASLTVEQAPARWVTELKAVVRDKLGKNPSRILVAAQSLITSDKTTFLEFALVDGTGRPVANTVVQIEDRGVVRTGRTNDFGRARLELSPRSKKKSATGFRPVTISTQSGHVSRQVYCADKGQTTRLLAFNLDPVLPLDIPLVKSAKVQLHPPPPAGLRIEARAPSGSSKSWLIKATLTNPAGESPSETDVVFSSSAGRLSQTKKVAQNVFEARLDPGPAGWGRIIVSASESLHHVGAVIQISESGGPR